MLCAALFVSILTALLLLVGFSLFVFSCANDLGFLGGFLFLISYSQFFVSVVFLLPSPFPRSSPPAVRPGFSGADRSRALELQRKPAGGGGERP